MALLFLIFWIRSVQNRSNMIKLDQIGFSQQSKNVTKKSCHICHEYKNDANFYLFLRSLNSVTTRATNLWKWGG